MAQAKRGPKGPSKYDDALADVLDTLGHEGEGIMEICHAMGISRETFYEWERKHEKFSDATKMYRVRYQAWWERLGRAGTAGCVAGFNATGYVWSMKNRFPHDWRDRHEISGPEGGPIAVSQEVSDDVRQALDAIAAKLASGTGAS